MVSPFRFLRFGRGQVARRDPDQLGNPFAVLEGVFDQKRILRPRIGRRLDRRADVRAPRRRRLHEELVVAHQRDDLSVQIDRVFPEHLPVRNLPRARHLVREELHEFQVRRHGPHPSRTRPEATGRKSAA